MQSEIKPTEDEIRDYAITLKNGIEIGLGKNDPGIRLAAKIEVEYPHHLILLQDGAFLHSYGRSAYFLYKLKKYKLRVVGPENLPNIRCGMPVAAHKRRLWHVVADFKVPYVIALGNRAAYELHVSNADVSYSLMDEIPQDIVKSTIDGLFQTDRLRVSKAVQILLNPAQRTFRLKEVAITLYKEVIQKISTLPTNHRYFIGKDIGDCLGRILRLIYGYVRSADRFRTLSTLSGEIDLLKEFLVALHHIGKPPLLKGTQFSLWTAMAIELGDLTGGLLQKSTSQNR